MSEGVVVAADGCRLAYEVVGDGRPVLWQHGLGADRAQPAAVFPAMPGVRRITLECRGHGRSALGDPARLSIACFAADVLMLLDHLQIERVVVGGISLGAAIALRIAALHPSRASGLILGRPAWVDGPSPDTLAPYLAVVRLLRAYGADEGARRFETSRTREALDAVSPDNARSLRAFFTRHTRESTMALLARIPLDTPGVSVEMMKRITAPALIVTTGQDYIHPLAYGDRLHALLPNAALRIVTSKTIDGDRYVAEFRGALGAFLTTLETAS